MPFLRFLLFPTTVGLILVATGAAAWQSLQPEGLPPLEPLPEARPDATSCQTFDRALLAFSPERLTWLETTVWQRVEVQGLAYEAEGRYLQGPDHLFRLDLTTRVGQAEGKVCVVSDGITLWEAQRVNSSAWTGLNKSSLRDVLKAAQEGLAAGVPDRKCLTSFGAHALSTQLQALRQQVVWVRKEGVRRKDQEWIKLTGVWNPTLAAQLASAGPPWPSGLPRQCRLYLHPQTHWPHRIEWWGPDPPRVGEVALLQMEYRQPVLNQPMSAERCAQEFSFDPGAPPR